MSTILVLAFVSQVSLPVQASGDDDDDSDKAGTSFELFWVKQIDPQLRGTMSVMNPPRDDSGLNSAFPVLSSIPIVYLIRLRDGAVLFHTIVFNSTAFNLRGSTFGLIPNQGSTPPLVSSENGRYTAWVTTGGGPRGDRYWLHVAATGNGDICKQQGQAVVTKTTTGTVTSLSTKTSKTTITSTTTTGTKTTTTKITSTSTITSTITSLVTGTITISNCDISQRGISLEKSKTICQTVPVKHIDEQDEHLGKRTCVTYITTSLNDLVDPTTGYRASLNPVSVQIFDNGKYIIVGGTEGNLAVFKRTSGSDD
jgi:hypothetical protein